MPLRAKAGFALIEVLASLVITLMLMVVLTPFVRQMLATWSRGGEAAALVEIERRGLGRLRDDARHAIAGAGYGRNEDLAIFRGNETSLSFPAMAGLGSSVTGVEYLSYTIENTADGRALVRRSAPMIGSSYGTLTDPVVIASGRFKFFFKYFSRDGREVAEWPATRFDLPARVDLNLTSENGSMLSIPVTLPIFASLSAGCFVNSGLQGCEALQKPATIDPDEWTRLFPGIPPPS
jgi:hypothetical protein